MPDSSPEDLLEAEQLFLPLAIKHAPPKVREHGLQEIHSFPLVSRGKGYAVTRKPARMAWPTRSCTATACAKSPSSGGSALPSFTA